jgi:hypothetical protein
MDLHRLAEERSLAYHRRVAALLPGRPELLAKAREGARRWASSGESYAPYAQRWLRLIDGPFEDLVAGLADPSESARAMRQATPFAGALDPGERWEPWRSVKEAFERETA